MGRTNARELIRAAQAAEIDKDFDRAASLLREAAQLRLDAGETGRALALFRHCLRLAPQNAEVERLVEELESAGTDDELQPRLPLELALASAEVEGADDSNDDDLPQRRDHLELPQRGPTRADPNLDCWCSFCCRPKAEVGPMIAGPAGAFICSACIRGAAAIAEIETAAPPEAPAPALEPLLESNEDVKPSSFIEAAVRLSRALGWSLDEVRSLSVEEREQALEAMDRLGVRLER